ncbi:MAG: hypothetical protein ACFFAE_20800 [Candidatus Hodarchaeota archaeon]
MNSNSEIPVFNSPFLDEVFFNSPLCQICEYASLFGGVCSLLLNRRIPVNLVVKNSQIVSCSAHRNWLQILEWNDESTFCANLKYLGKDQLGEDQDPG